ncbi:MAG: DUF2569 family protein [bacterium]|nr:DUF2569 family protein [Candidatus Kapabacteria bacterium]
MILFTCQNALRDQIVRVLEHSIPSTPNVTVIVVAIIAGVASAFAAKGIVARPVNLRRYDPDELAPKWRGFKGALLAVGLACGVEPFRVLLMTLCNAVVYTREAWTTLTVASKHFSGSGGESLLVFEAIAPAIQLSLAVGLVIAMVKRKRVFRSMAIFYLVGSVVALALNEFLIMQVFAEYREVTNENSRRLSTMAAVALPTIGYLLLSRRVQATFHR